MKLGVSYNVFDGEELLKGSIQQIREFATHINIVYQIQSNWGNYNNPLPLLLELKESGLVDSIELYTPDLKMNARYNETKKRNIGLECSKLAGCDYHISLDCDEYFIKSEFKSLIDKMESGNYDSSYCQIKNYYKSWNYQLKDSVDYLVPLIYKVDSGLYGSLDTPVKCDPTRVMSLRKSPLILDTIQMHHGTYIRDDIKMKLVNSSSRIGFSLSDIKKVVNHYENWKYPQLGFIISISGIEKREVVEVSPIFEV